MYLLYSCFYLTHLKVLPINALDKSMSTKGTKHLPRFCLDFTYKYQQCHTGQFLVNQLNVGLDCLGDIFLERCSKELLQLGSLCLANYRLTVANYAIFTRPRDSFFSFWIFPFKYAMFFVCFTPKEVFSHSDKTCYLFEMSNFQISL